MAANALAWALGLLVAFMGEGIQKTDGFTVQTALIEAATGAAMGAVIGGITGIVLVWLIKPRLQQHN
jgi:NhaP-type Na+/H+ or K+/H+ antiporter